MTMSESERFESLRPTLFSLAYRMLGSVAEAEDIVQEAFLRHQRALGQGVEIDSPAGVPVCGRTRLSIDHLRSARARREVYVGEWLPEPLLTDDDAWSTRPRTPSRRTRSRSRSSSCSNS